MSSRETFDCPPASEVEPVPRFLGRMLIWASRHFNISFFFPLPLQVAGECKPPLQTTAKKKKNCSEVYPEPHVCGFFSLFFEVTFSWLFCFLSYRFNCSSLWREILVIPMCWIVFTQIGEMFSDITHTRVTHSDSTIHIHTYAKRANVLGTS